MTAHTKARLVPREQLDEVIMDHMIQGVIHLSELVTLVGYYRSTIAKRLERMEEKGFAYRVRTHDSAGSPDEWYLVLQMDMDGKMVRPTMPGMNTKFADKPSQVTLKSYPSIGGRDYLVAALFGAPQASQAQEAAA
jgi:hypothetical protein